MKRSKITIGLFILTILNTITAFAQQEFTLTTSKDNVVASKVTIDQPGLAGNANAIIVATPLGDTAKLNPHPIGAWYYNDKWNIFNTDHATMPSGLTFKVQYFAKQSGNNFVHLVAKSNLQGESSYIDNPALNNNPKAQVTIFQNHAPDYREASLNKYEAIAEYDSTAGKWYIKNVNGERLYPNTAYNVVVSSGGITVPATPTSSIPTATPYVPIVGTSLAPPTLTVVLKVQWTIPHQAGFPLPPQQCITLNVNYVNPSILDTDMVIVTGQLSNDGMFLKWTANVENGAIGLNVCNAQRYSTGGPHLYLTNRKINILVLR
jgi:hypothetical protein